MNNLSKAHETYQAIKPRVIKTYAVSSGWKYEADFKDKFYIYAKDSIQLLIPKDTESIDYSRRVEDAVKLLAFFEKRDLGSLVNDIFNPQADVFRFRLAGKRYNDGTAPLLEGLNLLSGSKRSLYISAMQSIRPSSYYKRLSNNDIESFISSCKMGQTERGSFIVSLVCPLVLPGFESNLSLFNETPDHVKTFTRKVTTNFLQSVDAVMKTIDQDNPDFLKSNGVDIVSSNFCNSILEMKPEDSDSALELIVNMTQIDKIPELSSRILIQKDYFPLIEQISRSLKPKTANVATEFVGKVKTLNGNIGEDGKVQGEVVLTFIDDDQAMRAKINLSSVDYDLANEAHMKDFTIAIEGVLEESPRTSKFTQYSKFRIIK